MKQKKLATLVGAAGAVGLFAIGAIAEAHDHDDDPPTQDEIAFAQGTSDLMNNTLFAALIQEIGETTPQNAEQGKQSISLVFNDHNDDMRLVGTLDPLKRNDVPQDRFERTALAKAMVGQAYTAVERDDGRWFYRRSTPLSNFVPQCSMCHPNFGPTNANQWVGALMIRIPIRTH